MPNIPTDAVAEQLHRAALRGEETELTDGQLLEYFVRRREEAALAALVRRHAPMVWGVCRRVLPNHHDAEDAFQAAFLVFVRKAPSIAARELLANWLYGVAHQTALKARATAGKRAAREKQVTAMPEPAAERRGESDLPQLLDQELSRLPAKYRAPIVLCDLEGKTRREAAQQLGCPEGTVAGRLARARAMLAKRLGRRRAAPSVWSLLAPAGNAPAPVVSAAIRAATQYAAGPAAAAGAVSARVAALTEGVTRTMLLTRLKLAAALLLALALLGTGAAAAGFLWRPGPLAGPGAAPAAGPAAGKPGEKPAEPDEWGKRLKLEDWGLAVRTRVIDGQVQFDVAYGRNVTGISAFIVEDEQGNPLWSVRASGQNNIKKITYGVVPVDRNYAGRQQEVPADGTKPEDIRGKKVRIEVDYRDMALFGPGTEVYRDTVEVPKE
jgi:RNA polymerase sigma factor (sigma-70 family)